MTATSIRDRGFEMRPPGGDGPHAGGLDSGGARHETEDAPSPSVEPFGLHGLAGTNHPPWARQFQLPESDPLRGTAVKLHRLPVLSTLLVAACVLSGCTTEPVPSTPPAATDTIPSGTRGAAHLDEGYVELGSGPKIVDLFIDPLCPFCKLFEETSGQLLFADAAAGHTTLRIHPLATLNRLSQGTNYSTRASALFVAIAAGSPDHAQDFLVALYAHQPPENTPGLTTAQLEQLATSIGASPTSEEDLAGYQDWVNEHTRLALNGPLDATTEIAAITHVPSVVVNQAVFTGNSNETEAFAAFYNRH